MPLLEIYYDHYFNCCITLGKGSLVVDNKQSFIIQETEEK